MSIKTGSKPWQFAGNEQVEIKAEDTVSVWAVDEKGELKEYLASGRYLLSFRTVQPVDVYIKVPEGSHWSMDVTPIRPPEDAADPTPFEIPEDKKANLTLEDKLKSFIADMVAERYGADSEEMETLEESMDFGDDDEEIPLSGYEVQEMQPVEPDPPPGGSPEETPEPEPDPVPEESPPS